MWHAHRNFSALEKEGLRSPGLLVEGKRQECWACGLSTPRTAMSEGSALRPLTERVLGHRLSALILCLSTCVRGTVGVAEHPWVAL